HEGSPTAAGNLAWFLRQFCAGDGERCGRFDGWVGGGGGRRGGVLFLPYLYGSNLGGNTPGGLIGLSAHHEMADVVQAIYQGIVFSHLIHQERMVQLNPRIERVRMTGGPTQSEVWMPMYADAGNLPLGGVETRPGGRRAAAL
uniref:FGGY-family carbohydrate kinase n=1 Tax=Serratia marcescens TaxID=615 RepID=UPI00202111D7